MTKTVRLLCATAISVLVPLAITAQAEWKGSYSFHENGGKNAGGIAVVISHQIDVFDGDDGLAVTIESNGYQTSRDLVCTAKVEGAKLLIYFHSYGENNMFEPYTEGDLLLTLESKTEKGKKVTLTHWGKFTPAIEKYGKSGKLYFEKFASPK